MATLEKKILAFVERLAAFLQSIFLSISIGYTMNNEVRYA